MFKVIATGQTPIVLTGGIDLLCGMVMAFGSIVMTKFAVTLGVSPILAVLCGIAASTLFGALNGENLFLARELLKPGWRGSLFKMIDTRRMPGEATAHLKDLQIGIRSMRQTVETPSGGQRRGIAVARSAAFARHVVILDEPRAAHGHRALSPELCRHTEQWLDSACPAIASALTNAAAFLDLESIVIAGELDPQLVRKIIRRTERVLDRFEWQGIVRPQLPEGVIGADARATAGAILPLYAHFVPVHERFLKPASDTDY